MNSDEGKMLDNEQDSDLIDAITLIADFLERSTPLHETAALLRREVVSKHLLPITTTWNGQPIPGSLPNPRLLRALPKDHLIRSLRMLTNNTPPPAANNTAPTSLLLSTAVAMQSKLGNVQQQRKQARVEIQSLVSLRDEQRRLQREMQSDRGRSSQSLSAAILANEKQISNKLKEIGPFLLQVLVESSVSHSLQLRQLDPSSTTSLSNLRNRKENDHAKERLICSQYRVLKKIQGHRGPAYCLSASHPQWIFTGADDGLVKMWNPQTSRLHCAYRGNRQVVTDICHTNDLIASAAGDNSSAPAAGGMQQDNTVRIWEIGTTKLFACITQHKKPVQRVQFSPDETLLFSSAEDGTCAVWDVDSLRRQTQDRDRAKKVWMDREREKRQRSTEEFTEEDEIQLELDCAVIPLQIDPPLVFPHCKSKSGHGTDYKPVPLVCMAIHPTGKFVATGCEDSLGRVWSLTEIGAKCPPAASMPNMLTGPYRDGSRHLVCVLTGHTTGFVHHIEFSHRGDRILTFSDKDGTARVWFWPMSRGGGNNDFTSKPQQIILKAITATDVERGGGGHKKPNQHALIHAAAFSQSDDLVITSQSLKPSMYEGETAFWDSRVCVWDSRTGALLRFMRGHRMQAPIIRMHPELNWLGATCGTDGLILFWDFTTGEEIKRLDCISSEGYAGVCDAKWCNSLEQHSPVDFAVTDSMHRLCLIGTGEESMQSRANPPDQFLSNETSEIIYRALTLEPMDSVFQLPLHLMRPAPRLVDAYGDAYAHQPPPLPQGQGSYFAPSPVNAGNLRLRIEQAEELTKAVRKKEADARDMTAVAIAKQEELIALAAEQDVKLEEEKRLRPAAAAAAAAAVAGTGSRAAAATARRPKRQIAHSTPMWALERAALTLSSDTEEEEVVPQEVVQNGRKRRRAALRANRSIHRHTRHLVDQQQQTPSRTTVRIDDEEEEDDPVEYVQSDAGNGSSSEDEDEYAEDERLRFIVDDNDEIHLLSDDDEDDFEDDEGSDGKKKKRRRYRTRGKRTDYSRFYDGRPTSDDAAAAASLPPHPQQQPAPAPPAKQFSDEWLTSNTESALLVPQRGDQVVYFPQGHLEYLNRFPSAMAPPWHAWDTREWPYVLCQVDNVDYSFPTLQQEDEIHHILCRVTLRVTQVKAPHNADEFFIPVDNDITFTLEFHPFGNEFLVLYQRFLHSMQPIFLPGTPVKCIYISEDTLEIVPYEAKVVAISERDPVNWPESPWEAIECRFVEDASSSSEPSFFSPWDIEPTATNSPAASTTTTTTMVTIPKVSLRTQDFWALEHEGKPMGEWIASQIQSCTFPLFTLSKRKLGKSPIDLSIGLVCERLVNGRYYRQWDSIEADLERAVEYTTAGKDSNKAKEMLFEFREILQIARDTLPTTTNDNTERVDWRVFQHELLQALENTMRADREGYFAHPVDVDEVPDYYEIISNPMDFSTIREFCLAAEAPNEGSATFPEARAFIREVVAKIKLMALNAMTYNAETSLVFRRAKEVVKKMTSEFHDLKARALVARAEELEESTSEQDDGDDGIAELTSDEDDVHRRNSSKRKGTKYALRIRAPPPPQQPASRSRRNTRSSTVEKGDEDSPPQRVTTTRRRSKVEEEEVHLASSEDESADEESEDEDVFEEEEETPVSKPLRTKRPSKLPPPGSSEEEEEQEEETSRHSRSSRRSRASSQHHEEDEEENGARVLRRSTRAKLARDDSIVEDECLPRIKSSRSRSKPMEVVEELPLPTRSITTKRASEPAVELRKRIRALPVAEEEEEVLPVGRTRRRSTRNQKQDEEEVATRRTTRGKAKAEKRDNDEEVVPARRARRSSSSALSVSFNDESSEEEDGQAPSRRTRASTRSSTTTVESEEAPRSRRRSRASKPAVISDEDDEDDEEEEAISPKRRGSSRRRRSFVVAEEESEEEAPARRTRSSTASSASSNHYHQDDEEEEEEEEGVMRKSRITRKRTSSASRVEARKALPVKRTRRNTKLPSSSEDESSSSSAESEDEVEESFQAEDEDDDDNEEEEESSAQEEDSD